MYFGLTDWLPIICGVDDWDCCVSLLSLPHEHFTCCSLTTWPWTPHIAWPALSLLENLKYKKYFQTCVIIQNFYLSTKQVNNKNLFVRQNILFDLRELFHSFVNYQNYLNQGK